jgi:hypothetical protein
MHRFLCYVELRLGTATVTTENSNLSPDAPAWPDQAPFTDHEVPT